MMDSQEHHHSHTPSGTSREELGRGAEALASQDLHAGHSVAIFRDKFWISLVLTIPTLVWGHMLQQSLGLSAPRVPGAQWIPPVFGTAVFVYGGWVFIRGATRELADLRPGMMTLIALAISVAFAFSAVVTLGYPGLPLWEELSTLVSIMLLGHWIEMRAIAQATGAVTELAKLLPRVATRVVGDRTDEVPITELRNGDVVLIRPGSSIPADGVVRQGMSAVNESMLTGESRPIDKREGDNVIAGTLNGVGSLRVQVTGTGDRTALAGIMRLVEHAQRSRSRAQTLADRAALVLTLVALGAGIATVVVWLLLMPGDPAFAIERAVTVLVIACPHALGLAIPLVIAISTSIAARNGLLVRNRRGLEEARNLDVIVFDKTGTLTKGEFGVVSIATMDDLTADEALRLAAEVESDSEHSIAQGIVRSAKDRGLALRAADSFEAIPGEGVAANIEGRALLMGGPSLVRTRSLEVPPALQSAADFAAARGQASIFLADERRVMATFAVSDMIRAESVAAVRALQDRGIQVVMMTGDAQSAASAVAAELRIDTVFAGVLPGEKASKIEELKRTGKRVGMVGDGVNDAPALLTADVGIAIGAGARVSVEAGDIVLVSSDPRGVSGIIALSHASYRKMIQNILWAAGYNVIAIPLAAGVLVPWGFVLSPAAGAVLMSMSTVIVAINAQLIRGTKLGPRAAA